MLLGCISLLLWALISGTAHDALKVIKKPLEAVVIQEVIIPPPPPPPPKEIKPPEAPKVEAPPPPFVPPPDVAPPATSTAPVHCVGCSTTAHTGGDCATATACGRPSRLPTASDLRVACPTQVPPEMPRKAIQDGSEGVVKAQALIKDGVVKEVTILSGPRVFHASVKAAMMQYKCTADAGELLATQEFVFKIE